MQIRKYIKLLVAANHKNHDIFKTDRHCTYECKNVFILFLLFQSGVETFKCKTSGNIKLDIQKSDIRIFFIVDFILHSANFHKI